MSFNGWREVEIQEVCNIKRGASPRPIHEYIRDNGIPWVKIADATGGNSRFIHETKEFIKEEGKDKSRYIEKGTLILSNSATPGIPKIMKINACVHDGWLIIDNFNGIYKEYMYYMFIENREKLLNLSNGSVFRNLKTDIVKQFKVKIPPIEEQKAIAKILSDLDNKIEVNNKINKNLEEMAQAIFKQWFVDFEFPNEEGKPYKSSGGEMVESELGMIPKGWEIITIKDIAEIKTTSVKPQNNQVEIYEHYSIPAFDKNKYPVFEEGINIKSNKYKVYKDSILISKLNPDTKRMWKPLVLTDNAICSTEFINYVPKKEIFESLLYSIIDSENFTEFLNKHTTGSTGSRQRANPKSTYDYKFAILKDNEKLNLFSKAIKSIILRINNNLIEINKLNIVRDTLLPKLMSGEIRVPN